MNYASFCYACLRVKAESTRCLFCHFSSIRNLTWGLSHNAVLMNHLECQWDTRLLAPIPRDSGSVGLGWGPRICISNMSGDANAAGLMDHTLSSTGLNHGRTILGWQFISELQLDHYWDFPVWRTCDKLIICLVLVVLPLYIFSSLDRVHFISDVSFNPWVPGDAEPFCRILLS